MSDTINDLPETGENGWPPVKFSWVENDPRYKDGVLRMVFGASGVTLFTVIPRRQNLGWFGPVTYKYEVSTSLRHPNSGFRIGDLVSTLEEAKAYAERTATSIIRGNDFVAPGRKSDV